MPRQVSIREGNVNIHTNVNNCDNFGRRHKKRLHIVVSINAVQINQIAYFRIRSCISMTRFALSSTGAARWLSDNGTSSFSTSIKSTSDAASSTTMSGTGIVVLPGLTGTVVSLFVSAYSFRRMLYQISLACEVGDDVSFVTIHLLKASARSCSLRRSRNSASEGYGRYFLRIRA